MLSDVSGLSVTGEVTELHVGESGRGDREWVFMGRGVLHAVGGPRGSAQRHLRVVARSISEIELHALKTMNVV